MPRLRAAAAVALLVVGVLLVPVGAVAAWARGLVVDTDRFVRTTAPLVEVEAVRASIADRTTAGLVTALDLPALADELAEVALAEVATLAGGRDTPRIEAAVRAMAAAALDQVVRLVDSTVTRVLESATFAAAWERACRRAHSVLVGVLRGDPEAVARIDEDGALVINLSPVVEAAAAALAEQGVELSRPPRERDVVLAAVPTRDLLRLQGAYRLVDFFGRFAPMTCLIALAGGVALTRRRRRTVVVVALAAAGMALAAVAGLVVARAAYVDASSAPADAAGALFDQVVSLLRVRLWVTFAGALLASLAAAVLGWVTLRQAASDPPEASGRES